MSTRSAALTAAEAASHRQRAWHSLIDATSASYRRAGLYARHFARGKLGVDPVFRHLLERGLIAPAARVLDVGCGQGLLASLLRAAGASAREGRWPAGWAAAPLDARVTGIELMQRDVTRARTALGDDASFVCADMRAAAFPPADVVVILDALHYIETRAQDAVLQRARGALGAGGSLVLRIGDAGSGRRYALGVWIDRLMMGMRGGGFMPLAGRTLAQWTAALTRLGFEVDAHALGGPLPFANRLLIARVPGERGVS